MTTVLHRAQKFYSEHVNEHGIEPAGPFVVFESEWEAFKRLPETQALGKEIPFEDIDRLQICGMKILLIKK